MKYPTSFKSVIATLLLCITCGVDSSANELNEEQLRMRIDDRDTVIDHINAKKKGILIDSLKAQVEDLRVLVDILDEQVDSVTKRLNEVPEIDYSIWPLPLLMGDTDIFQVENLKGRNVPAALKPHYDVICLISDIENTLSETEAKIDKASQDAIIYNRSPKELIVDAIGKDVDKLVSLLTQVNESGTSTLSEPQLDYLATLKQRYNNLSQYFE